MRRTITPDEYERNVQQAIRRNQRAIQFALGTVLAVLVMVALGAC